MSKHKAITFLITLFISLIGGFIFYCFHLPLPWMLGPITMILLWKALVKTPLYWPGHLRQIGLAVIGFFLGSTFTQDIFASILFNLPYMFLSTILLILFSLAIAYFLARSLAITFPTAVIGNMPGGFSQMVVLGEELKSVDSTPVLVMQTIRIIVIVFTVPFITRFGLANSELPSASLADTPLVSANEVHFASYFVYLIVIIICIWIANKLKLPTAFLIGALVGTVLLILIDVPGPQLPSTIFIMAQLFIGSSLGLSIKLEELRGMKKLVLYSIFSSLLLVLFTGGAAYLLSLWLNVPLSTSFLSLAPGGIPEMGVIGKEIRADLSMITSYQLFRLFFILFLVPPLLTWWFSKPKFVEKERAA